MTLCQNDRGSTSRRQSGMCQTVWIPCNTYIDVLLFLQSLKLSSQARKETTVGEIVNLMAIDATRYVEMMNMMNMVWKAPVQIALAVYFLWDLMGPSVLAGFITVAVLLPLHVIIARKNEKLQVSA